jgi:arylsulfatase A-like enzyme
MDAAIAPFERTSAWFVARQPVTQLAILAALVRTVGLFRHYFGTDLLGHPITVEAGRFLPWAIPYHVGLLMAFAVPFVAAASLMPRLRRVIFALALPLFAFLVLYGQVDLELMRGLGTHLTPSFIAQYVGSAMFADVGQGIGDDAPHIIVSVSLVVGAWITMGVVWQRQRREEARPLRVSGLVVLPVLGAACIAFPHVYNWSSNRLRVVVPPEVLVLRAIFDDDRTPPPDDPQGAIARFRSGLGLEGAASDTSPLGHRPAAAHAKARPDVYFVVVESLRGRELHPEHSSADDHPNLSTFAARGVHFPYFVSNGFPSSAGFFSLQCSGWPHPSRFVLTDFASHRFDCLAPRLHALGYETAFFTATNPSMDNQLPWARKLYESVFFGDVRTHDRQLVEDVDRWLGSHDRRDTRPIFAWLATVSTHHPFLVTDPQHPPVDSQDLGVRYHDALRYTDAQLGQLVTRLEASAKARGRDLVVVIVGDHAFPVDEPASPELEAQGCDRRVWTSAILLGPPSLIGPPRTLTFPASQVDLMPTVLSMVGDDGPTAALGRDLFDTDPRPRQAVVVTHGGLRIDLETTSIFTSVDGTATWREDRVNDSGCALSGPVDAETQQRARELVERVRTWSWLVESNRVWGD